MLPHRRPNSLSLALTCSHPLSLAPTCSHSLQVAQTRSDSFKLAPTRINSLRLAQTRSNSTRLAPSAQFCSYSHKLVPTRRHIHLMLLMLLRWLVLLRRWVLVRWRLRVVSLTLFACVGLCVRVRETDRERRRWNPGCSRTHTGDQGKIWKRMDSGA